MKAGLAKEVELLSDISKALAESLDLEETLMSILKSFDTHLKLRRGTITLLDPDTETINVRLAHGLSKKSQSMASYKVGESCRTFLKIRVSCIKQSLESRRRASRLLFSASL